MYSCAFSKSALGDHETCNGIEDLVLDKSSERTRAVVRIVAFLGEIREYLRSHNEINILCPET